MVTKAPGYSTDGYIYQRTEGPILNNHFLRPRFERICFETIRDRVANSLAFVALEKSVLTCACDGVHSGLELTTSRIVTLQARRSRASSLYRAQPKTRGSGRFSRSSKPSADIQFPCSSVGKSTPLESSSSGSFTTCTNQRSLP